MTLPSIVPTGYDGTATDFTKAKADHSGATRLQPFNVSIPSGTVTSTIVGLIPVRKGARLSLNGSIFVSDALGTSVTAGIGIVYNDNTNNTNNQTLWVSAATTPAAGGTFTLINTYAAASYFATDDGWIVLTTGGATTGSTGTIHGQVAISYDSYAL